MLDYTLTVNSTDLTNYIQYDSYATKKIPVYSDAVVTMDGVTHVALIRTKGSVSFKLNPQDATTTATIASALLNQPCSVYYYSLQSQGYETGIMQLSEQSAEYLALCKAYGLKWNQIADIELVEL